MSIKIVSQDTFEEEVLNHEGRVLVDFYGDNCAPCKVVASILEDIQEDVTANIVKIDAHANMDLSQEHGVRGIPALFLYENGKIIKDHVGVLNKEKMKDWLDN